MSRTTRAHSASSRKLSSSRERGGGTTWQPFAGARALLARGKEAGLGLVANDRRCVGGRKEGSTSRGKARASDTTFSEGGVAVVAAGVSVSCGSFFGSFNLLTCLWSDLREKDFSSL